MPAPSRIVVAGSSSGGYGAIWTLGQIQNEFGVADTNIQLIDDCGPYLLTPYFTPALQSVQASSWWGTGTGTIPQACASAGYNCDPRMGGQFNALLGDLHTELPNLRASLIIGMADDVISTGFSRLTFGPPDNQPPYAPKPCGSASDGDCNPYGYPGLEVDKASKLFGYFCTEALPDYTANEPAGFKSFEITTSQRVSTGTTYPPSHHQWLVGIPLTQVHAVDNTLLSDFISDQLSGTGVAWADHVYTSSDASITCQGWSF
jgi:hypothetical protein